MKKYMLFSAFLFATFSLWLLIQELEPFLRETALMTPMLNTSVFATEMISQPCGALFWLASLLQSTLIWPYIGAVVLTIVLMLLAFVVKQAFRISDEWAGIAWLPSLALLLSYTQTGYMLYLLKMPGVAFTWPLGILIAVLLLWLWRLTIVNHSLPYQGLWKMPWLRIPLLGVLLLLSISIFYWLIGVFALIAVVLVVFSSLKTKASVKTRITTSFFLIAVIAVVPRLLYAMGFIRLRQEAIYMAGIPDYQWTDSERSLFYPLIFTVVLLIVLAILKPMQSFKEKQTRGKIIAGLAISAILLVGGCWLVWKNSFRDQNFLSILKMKESAEKGDWEGVLTLSRANDTEPTRAQVCLTRLALYKLGRMGDELFTYPDGSANYQSPRAFPYLRLMIGRLLYFHYGKVNYSYRWAMEDMVEYGMRPDYIRYMFMAAETNGEKALAKKYRDALEKMIGMKGRIIASPSNPRRSKNAEKKGEPFELMNYADVLDGDAGLIEFYLLNSFAMTEGGSREMVELSMMNNLITKNLESFWPRFFKLLPTWQGHIPRHYQEAALMIAQLTGRNDLLTNIPIDPDVSERFERLVTASAQNGDNDYNKMALKGEFGNTYWYYYFFVEGLKTT